MAIITETVRLPINWGGAGNIIAIVERGARKYDLKPRTNVIKMGWLSSRVDFEITGEQKDVTLFLRR